MNITRFEPWSLINLLHQDLDQIAGRRIGLAGGDHDGSSVADWIPAVDIVEEKDRYVLRADVPGERHQESTEEAQGMRRVERVSGKFYRRFTLPDTADAEEISAKSANGILEVIIPKQPQVLARKITVKAA